MNGSLKLFLDWSFLIWTVYPGNLRRPKDLTPVFSCRTSLGTVRFRKIIFSLQLGNFPRFLTPVTCPKTMFLSKSVLFMRVTCSKKHKTRFSHKHSLHGSSNSSAIDIFVHRVVYGVLRILRHSHISAIYFLFLFSSS